MRVLTISSFVALTACTRGASVDRHCEEMEEKFAEATVRLDETRARLDETTQRLDEAVRRITELEARSEEADARQERLERVEEHLDPARREPEIASDEPDLDRILACEGGRCTITRAGFEQIFASPEWLARQARIVPFVENGEHEGFKIYGIRANSLPHRLDLKNGDHVVTINGQSLGSLDQALKVYVDLRRSTVSKLEVDVRRQNESQTLTLHIE